MHLDDRLPDLVEITNSNRQQVRRIESRSTPCKICKRPVVPEDLCFADGQDCHRSCAEIWNYELIQGFQTLMLQDAEREGDEWIPPTLTPAASTPE